MIMPFGAARSRTRVLLPAMAMALLALPGCGGGDSGSSGTPGPVATATPTPTPTPAPQLSSVGTTYQIEIANAASGQVLGIAGASQVAGAAVATGVADGSAAQRWHVMPMASGQYNVENMLSHQVLGISGASTADGAAALQWADNGTADHLWSFYALANGNYLIKNINSGLYLQADGAGATIQAARSSGSAAQEWTLNVTDTRAYPLPQAMAGTGTDVHDPDLIRDPSGTYWLYGTHNTLAKSTDMVTFIKMTTGIFTSDFPWWASKNTTGSGGRTDLWAPSVMYANGTYYQYYSIPIYGTPSQAGTNQGAQAVIALATSKYPDGPWTDAGEIIASCGTTAGCTTGFNAIDPAPYMDDAGNWWMAFGSWEDGIHVLQLDPATGLRLASNPTIYDIARRGAGEEGPYIFPRVINGTRYYYYFAPINECCKGTQSKYRIIMGRSTSPTGPFLDRGGLDLMQGGGTILLSTHGDVFGPGGQSVMEGPDGPVLVYHYYDGARNGAPKLGLNKLVFDAQGWPRVE